MMKSKNLLLTLTVLLCLLLFISASSAGEETSGTCGENLAWTLNDEILTISGTGDMTNYDWGDYAPWYTHCNEITRVVIESGVSSIGDCAFLDCALTEISIPDSVTSIGNSAFENCVNLIDVMIPKGVLYIGDYAFCYCTSLQAFSVASQNIAFSVSDNVLFNKGKTQLIKYPAAKADSGYTIPASVTQIKEDAFDYLVNLNRIDVASGNTSFTSEDGVLFNWAKTSLIRYPSCMSWIEFFVPDGVVEIFPWAFSDTELESLYLPRSIEKIGYFWSQNLRDIYYSGSETDWNTIEKDGEAFSEINVHCIACGDALTWSIEDNVLIISGNGAMYDFEYPKYNSKTDMLENADKVEPWYRYRTWIGEIIIQPGVTNIGEYAFYDLSYLTNITIPNGVTSIGKDAFYKCASLTSVVIPDSVTSIEIPFYTSCIVSYNHPSFSTVDGVLFNKDGTCLINYPIVKTSSVYTIPNSVTKIDDNAFANCSNLTSVTIPNSVTSMGVGAFYRCSGLQNVIIPNSLTSINDGTFYGCSGMTSITIPGSVTSIGIEAFEECTNLTNVTIPNSVISIGRGAFYGCSGMMSITIPDSMTSIGIEAFSECTSLPSVTIPNSVTSIGHAAFYDCYNLTNVTLPDNVETTIGEAVFMYCSSLTDIVIPNGVHSIDNYMFYGCSSLTAVTIPKAVTYLGENVFVACDQLTLVDCFPGSVAHTYAMENNIPFTLMNVLNFRLPTQTTSIESEAFADLPDLLGVYIPSGCTDIATDAFGDAEVVIYGITGSFAETFAEQKGYPFVVME